VFILRGIEKIVNTYITWILMGYLLPDKVLQVHRQRKTSENYSTRILRAPPTGSSSWLLETLSGNCLDEETPAKWTEEEETERNKLLLSANITPINSVTHDSDSSLTTSSENSLRVLIDSRNQAYGLHSFITPKACR
jgi:hypothetical protein